MAMLGRLLISTLRVSTSQFYMEVSMKSWNSGSGPWPPRLSRSAKMRSLDFINWSLKTSQVLNLVIPGTWFLPPWPAGNEYGICFRFLKDSNKQYWGLKGFQGFVGQASARHIQWIDPTGNADLNLRIPDPLLDFWRSPLWQFCICLPSDVHNYTCSRIIIALRNISSGIYGQLWKLEKCHLCARHY